MNANLHPGVLCAGNLRKGGVDSCQVIMMMVIIIMIMVMMIMIMVMTMTKMTLMTFSTSELMWIKARMNLQTDRSLFALFVFLPS